MTKEEFVCRVQKDAFIKAGKVTVCEPNDVSGGFNNWTKMRARWSKMSLGKVSSPESTGKLNTSKFFQKI